MSVYEHPAVGSAQILCLGDKAGQYKAMMLYHVAEMKTRCNKVF